MARRGGKYRTWGDQEFFCQRGVQPGAGDLCGGGIVVDECGAVCGDLCGAWMDSHLCGDSGGDCCWISCRGGCRDARFAALCADASGRGANFLLHAAEVDGGYALARRGYLARDVLSVGGIETRRGLNRLGCFSRPLGIEDSAGKRKTGA